MDNRIQELIDRIENDFSDIERATELIRGGLSLNNELFNELNTLKIFFETQKAELTQIIKKPDLEQKFSQLNNEVSKIKLEKKLETKFKGIDNTIRALNFDKKFNEINMKIEQKNYDDKFNEIRIDLRNKEYFNKEFLLINKTLNRLKTDIQNNIRNINFKTDFSGIRSTLSINQNTLIERLNIQNKEIKTVKRILFLLLCLLVIILGILLFKK